MFKRMFLWACVGMSAILPIAPVHAANVMPVPADTFVDSIGVNYYVDADAQLHVGGLSYAQAFQDLRKLGVRHVRGVLWGKPPTYSIYNHLNASLGIRFEFGQGYQNPSTIPGLLAKYRDHLKPGVLEGLEGVNEPDVFPPVKSVITHEGVAAGAQMVYSFQQALYTAMKRDPAFRNVPVLAPPLSSSSALARRLASLNIEQFVDEANAHPYPEVGPATNPAPPELNAARTDRIALARTVSPRKPLVATETNTTGGKNAAEPSEGIYAPRLLLINFQDGCQRSYYYSLVSYGDSFPPLFGTKGKTNYTAPNPEAYAIMHLIGPGGVLYEPHHVAPAHLTRLNFTLSDVYDPRTNANGVASQLFEKSDGTYRLALWRPNFRATNTATPNVTLTLPGDPSAVKLYTFLEHSSMSIASLHSGSKLSIPVGARVIFVGISPKSATPGGIERNP